MHNYNNTKRLIVLMLCAGELLISCGTPSANNTYTHPGYSMPNQSTSHWQYYGHNYSQESLQAWREEQRERTEEFRKQQEDAKRWIEENNDPEKVMQRVKREQQQREDEERRIQKEWEEWRLRTFGSPAKEETEAEKQEREIRKKRGEDWLREGAEKFKKEQEERGRR